MSQKESDIIIIGAGMAGISAAKACKAYNDGAGNKTPLEYIVLEGADQVGGRVQSIELAGQHIDTGAEWLHKDIIRPYAPRNPLLEEARRLGLHLIRDSMPRDFFHRGQVTRWGPNIRPVEQARKLMSPFADPKYAGPDMSLKHLFASDGLDNTSLSLETTFAGAETGESLDKVSTVDYSRLVACNMGHFVREGMGEFAQRYAQDVRDHIELGKEVERICWKPGGVEIFTKDGGSYKARKCILTVSVGVLKSGAITFEPELPESFRENLSHIHMGNFNKVLLVFDEDFRFPVNMNTHMDVRTRGEDDIFYLTRSDGKPVVKAFFGADLARCCDSSPDYMTKKAIEGLGEIWGKEIENHIIGTDVTQWGKNPLVRGGYSRVDVGYYDVRQALAQPIENIIFPAGEACGAVHPRTRRDWSTHVSGAALSGERAAKLVIEHLRGVQKSFAERSRPTSDRQVGL